MVLLKDGAASRRYLPSERRLHNHAVKSVPVGVEILSSFAEGTGNPLPCRICRQCLFNKPIHVSFHPAGATKCVSFSVHFFPLTAAACGSGSRIRPIISEFTRLQPTQLADWARGTAAHVETRTFEVDTLALASHTR